MILVDIGLTILGGPEQSPAAFIVNLFSLPSAVKERVADVVFQEDHETPESLALGLAPVVGRPFNESELDKLGQYWRNQVQACTPLPGATEFCHNLIAAGYRYSIVSNLWAPFHQALKKYLPEFEAGAVKTFLSYKMEARKPGQAFYDQVYSQINAPADKMVVVGDSLKNDIEPCLARGSHGVLLASRRFRPDPRLAGEMEGRYPGGRFHWADNHRQCFEIIEHMRFNK